jgi:hypothetical protein
VKDPPLNMAANSSPIDPKVEALVAQHIKDSAANDEDEDALFASLEAEDDSAFRAARAQQLSEELAKHRPTTTHIPSVNLYRTLHSDDEVLRFTTETEKVVLHFSHGEFNRCATMDRHLQRLAEARAKYSASGDDQDVRFARVDVKDCPFLVEKLGVRVLPCVIGFIEGQGVGRIVGFEGLGVWAGGREDRIDVTTALEEKLIEMKICGKKVVALVAGMADEGSDDEEEEQMNLMLKSGRRGIQGSKITNKNEDDDEEWD